MEDINGSTGTPERYAVKKKGIYIEGYPSHPAKEDIYAQSEEQTNADPEDISRNKNANEEKGEGLSNEKDFEDDVSGGDLDVPGSELDDEDENTGSEDEENNYYSIGGDEHNDLDEDKG